MTTTLFVVDDDTPAAVMPPHAISFSTYLRDYPKLHEPRTRVINLCDSRRYLSRGYYCSLLAEARQHQVLPSIKVINQLRSEAVNGMWLNERVLGKEPLHQPLQDGLVLCMGEVQDSRYRRLAALVYQAFPAPLLQLTLHRDKAGLRVNVAPLGLGELNPAGLAFAHTVFEAGAPQSWKKRSPSKHYRWDLALLVDPNEAVPPSNKGALSRFIKAGDKLGIRVQTVTAAEIRNLNQFDGLFIRETTAIDHHTYRLASEAEAQGLVVIDDSDSILRCCNKVFLHDAFNYKKVPSLQTVFVSDDTPATLDVLEQRFGYPMVLKMPEGSFSRGVFKVEQRQELDSVVNKMLSESALVLAQEYLFTDYDWRIGVLNGRALYACRYYMARNHWQIYNHGSKGDFSGGFDALPTFEVPSEVLDAALKAASVVGNGLYGIDIKQLNGRAYVLEVNDNPSIEHGVEDSYLGEELYMQIMSEFLRRLELRGR